MKKVFCLLLFFFAASSAEIVETVYGDFDVQEEVILELVECPAFQRLKHVHQYGIVPYFEECEEYTRYQHSLGVFALLRKNGLPLEEQIAGLLHDVSHTVFSHFGDYFFQFFSDENSYQDSIHEWYLHASGIGKVLERHGLKVNEVLHKSGNFHAAARPLPNLSADRGDYNIQGAYRHGDITYDEMLKLFDDLQYLDGHWTLSNVSLAEKIGRFSLHMSVHAWSGPYQAHANTLLAEALHILVDEGTLSLEDIYFGVDHKIWQVLQDSDHPKVKEKVWQILHIHHLIEPCAPWEAEYWYRIKLRGINPMMRTDKGLVRLTSISNEYYNQFLAAKGRAEYGWSMRDVDPADRPLPEIPLFKQLSSNPQ